MDYWCLRSDRYQSVNADTSETMLVMMLFIIAKFYYAIVRRKNIVI